MKKISYRNKDSEQLKSIKTELPSVGSSNDSSTENAGRFGYILPGTTDDQELPDQKMNNSEHVNIIRNLVEMADDLDKDEMESEAGFLDFLIRKFAESIVDSDQEEKYIEYIYKIYNSDLPMSIDRIKTLSDEYSKSIMTSINSGEDKESSKSLAFKKMLLDNSND